MTDKPTRPNRGLASSQTAREINQDIVLRTIHLRQPVSRADLARLTGPQASTVSPIIGQLIEEGWVSPGTLGRLPRGRGPTFMGLDEKHVTPAVDLRPGEGNLASIDIHGKIFRRETIQFSSLGTARGRAVPNPTSGPHLTAFRGRPDRCGRRF